MAVIINDLLSLGFTVLGGFVFLIVVFACLLWWSLNTGPGKHANKKIPPPPGA